MTDYIELLTEAQKQLDEERHIPSMNKLINAVIEFDSDIQTVAIIVNGHSLRQNEFNAHVIDILDIINNDAKKSIKKEVSKVLEENKYEADKLVISEAVKNKLNKCNAVLFIETESVIIKKNKDIITTHRWRLVNSK